MQSALPPLITTAASRALYLIRVEGSRSDLSCHQLASTWHRAAGLLHGLLQDHSHQKFWHLFFCDLAVLHTDFFFFNDTATTEIYTLSLHDALPNSGLSPPAVTTISCTASRLNVNGGRWPPRCSPTSTTRSSASSGVASGRRSRSTSTRYRGCRAGRRR